MNTNKLRSDDVNKGFEDTGCGSHATRITNTRTTDEYQPKGKRTSRSEYTINLVNAESDKNQMSKHRHSVDEIQKSRGSSRWRQDTRLIQRIVLLENEIGRPLTMFDLLCRLDRREIDSVSDILYWLVVQDDAYKIWFS